MIIKPGTIIYDNDKNKYIIIDSEGTGGFASVFKIERENDKSIYALKTLLESYSDDKLLRGLINEANLATNIIHQNVIKYLFFHDGSMFNELPPYIIMEYANQGTLWEIIQKQSAKKEFLPNNELRQYFNDLINGMEVINAKLIHRDIKPKNILIKDDILKISDFGLSKIVEEKTRTLSFKGFGTAEYAAPECWKNDKNTIKMDIYSMGVVFFELATLQHPLKINNTNESINWQDVHLFQAPQKPEKINTNITPVFSQVILKMLEKDTSKRFNNWGEIRDELRKESLPKTNNTVLIDTMLKRRLDIDSKIQAEQLEKQKRETEIEEFKKIVNYQFVKDIIEPLGNLIKEFNVHYLNGKIQLQLEGKNKCRIRLVSGRLLILEINELIDEDFYRRVVIDDYGRQSSTMRLERPLFNKKKIMAWGCLRNQYGKGFNILLIEKEGEVYGEWVILWNTNSGLGNRRPVEPFAFDFFEIEKEIKYVGMMHACRTQVKNFQIDDFVKFLDESI
jgi:serine/threonine protein kinase